MTHPYYHSYQKRIFDVLLATTLLIFLFPLLLFISLVIATTTGLPIIFFQTRIGKKGQSFTLLKFRTMKKNAERIKHLYKHKNNAPEPMFKIHNDPRFVGFGKFLSRSGLDELPQLINILKGEMSFVGPRPLPIKEALALPTTWKKMREQVKPGIFSKWTLAKNRHSSLKNWKRLDKKTIENGSVLKDLFLITKIIFTQLNHLF